MANHGNSGAQLANAVYTVATFVSYTVYAANGSTVTAAVSGTNVATYTVGATGALTISDLADTVSVNAAFRVVGLVSTTVN
jgi:hypothetical protein